MFPLLFDYVVICYYFSTIMPTMPTKIQIIIQILLNTLLHCDIITLCPKEITMKNKWYKDCVIYQIYPRSFADSNGDGIGDIKGVISHIDHLVELGVGAVWFSPLYASPNYDYGYDISDYKAINPEYGTMEDFEQMVQLLHSHNIKVIMDLVINHTSSHHKWFEESRKSKDTPYRDYYYWRDGRGKNGKKPPNNWSGFFLGSAWEYDEQTNQWYMHLFDKNQPDLNYNNSKVMDEIKSILRFWLDKGTDGFRCDVITLLDKTVGLPNGRPTPILAGKEHYIDGPRMESYLEQIQSVLREYDAFTVGESTFINVDKALRYTDEKHALLNTVFAFDHMGADSYFGVKQLVRKFRLSHLKKCIELWQHGLENKSWNSLYFENHDQARIVGRYCDDTTYRVEGAKMIATLLMTLCGTPYVYQGQEIGTTSIRMTDLSQYKDVESLRSYRTLRKLFGKKGAMKRIAYCSRDNARTPVQWNDQPLAGFTTGDSTWLAVNPNYTTVNVAKDKADSNGVFGYYKKLIALRKSDKVYRYGSYTDILPRNNKIMCYSRKHEDDELIVILNFRTHNVPLKLPTINGNYKLVTSNYSDSPLQLCNYTLRPHEAVVYRKQK